MGNERFVNEFCIVKEEVLEPNLTFARHDVVVTMRHTSVVNDKETGWVSFFLNREGEVERRNGGGAPVPPEVYREMIVWAGTILRGIARRMKQGRQRAERG
jgi:hypothetical protein